jgi:hypothetical protein
VKNQLGFVPELLQISRSEKPALLNFPQSCDKLCCKKLPRSAPGTQEMLAPTRLRRVMPPQAACRARFASGL